MPGIFGLFPAHLRKRAVPLKHESKFRSDLRDRRLMK